MCGMYGGCGVKDPIIADYESGMTLRELRKKYMTTSIYYKTGVVPNRKVKLTEQDHKAIINAYESNMPKAEIESMFKISWQTVKNILKGYNIPYRGKIKQRRK